MRLAIEILALILLTVAGCGNDDGGASADAGPNDGNTGCSIEGNFTSLHDNLLSSSRCAIAGCHAASSMQGNLNFEAGKQAVYDQLLDGETFNSMATGEFPSRVVGTDPASSYLYVKVSEAAPIGGGSGRMPPGLPLADCEIEIIRDWIDEGAPNN